MRSVQRDTSALDDERFGFIVFVGRGRCASCHSFHCSTARCFRIAMSEREIIAVTVGAVGRPNQTFLAKRLNLSPRETEAPVTLPRTPTDTVSGPSGGAGAHSRSVLAVAARLS